MARLTALDILKGNDRRHTRDLRSSPDAQTNDISRRMSALSDIPFDVGRMSAGDLVYQSPHDPKKTFSRQMPEFVGAGEFTEPSDSLKAAIVEAGKATSRRAEAQALASTENAKVSRRMILADMLPALAGTFIDMPSRSESVNRTIERSVMTKAEAEMARRTADAEIEVAEADTQLQLEKLDFETEAQRSAHELREEQAEAAYVQTYNDLVAQMENAANEDERLAIMGREANTSFLRANAAMSTGGLEAAVAILQAPRAMAKQQWEKIDRAQALYAGQITVAESGYPSREAAEAFLTTEFSLEGMETAVAQSLSEEYGNIPWNGAAAAASKNFYAGKFAESSNDIARVFASSQTGASASMMLGFTGSGVTLQPAYVPGATPPTGPDVTADMEAVDALEAAGSKVVWSDQKVSMASATYQRLLRAGTPEALAKANELLNTIAANGNPEVAQKIVDESN